MFRLISPHFTPFLLVSVTHLVSERERPVVTGHAGERVTVVIGHGVGQTPARKRRAVAYSAGTRGTPRGLPFGNRILTDHSPRATSRFEIRSPMCDPTHTG